MANWIIKSAHRYFASFWERMKQDLLYRQKNWLFHDSVKGAKASAIIYSISETAKLNDLRPYFYFGHLLYGRFLTIIIYVLRDK